MLLSSYRPTPSSLEFQHLVDYLIIHVSQAMPKNMTSPSWVPRLTLELHIDLVHDLARVVSDRGLDVSIFSESAH